MEQSWDILNIRQTMGVGGRVAVQEGKTASGGMVTRAFSKLLDVLSEYIKIRFNIEVPWTYNTV